MPVMHSYDHIYIKDRAKAQVEGIEEDRLLPSVVEATNTQPYGMQYPLR